MATTRATIMSDVDSFRGVGVVPPSGATDSCTGVRCTPVSCEAVATSRYAEMLD